MTMHPARELNRIDAATSSTMSPDALIKHQQKTVAKHISHEQAKQWPEV
jgi:hypothetical protein